MYYLFAVLALSSPAMLRLGTMAKRGLAMKCRFASTWVFFALASIMAASDQAAAQAKKSPSQHQQASLSFTETELRRAAFSGNNVRLGVFWTVDSNCKTGSLVDVRIVKPPQHGELSFQEIREAVEVKKDHLRAHCIGKPVDGVGMFYQSRETYSGTERFQVEVDYKQGFVRRYTVIVNVR